MSPSLALGRSGYRVFPGCSAGIGVTEYLTSASFGSPAILGAGCQASWGCRGNYWGLAMSQAQAARLSLQLTTL